MISILYTIFVLFLLLFLEIGLNATNLDKGRRWKQFLNPFLALFVFAVGTIFEAFFLDFIRPLISDFLGTTFTRSRNLETWAGNITYDFTDFLYYFTLSIFYLLTKSIVQRFNSIAGFGYIYSNAGSYYIREKYKSWAVILRFWLGNYKNPFRFPILTVCYIGFMYVFLSFDLVALPPELLLIVFATGKELQYYFENELIGKEKKKKQVKGKAPKPLKIGLYEDFWIYCHEKTLSNNILTSYKEIKERSLWSKDNSSTLNTYWSNLLSSPSHPDIQNLREILDATKKSDDVLTTLSSFDLFAPILLSEILESVANGKKVLFILAYPNYIVQDRNGIKNNTYFDAFDKWLRSYLDKAGFHSEYCKIFSFKRGNQMPFDKEASVLLVSPRDIFSLNNFEIISDWLEQVSLILTDDISRLFRNYTLETQFLLEEIIARNPKVRFHFLTSDREEAEGGLVNNIRRDSKLDEQKVHVGRPPISYIILWALERDMESELKIGGVEEVFYADMLLGAAATAFEISGINLITHAKFPSRDSNETLHKRHKNFNFPIYEKKKKKIAVDFKIPETISYVPDNLIRVGGRKFYVSFDFNFNLSTLIQTMEENAVELAFSNIVSPRYLLRDYMADNLPYFKKHSLIPYSVGASVNQVSAALQIHQLLLNAQNFVPEDRINKILKTIPDFQNNNSIPEQLHELFQNIFKVKQNPQDYLDAKTEKSISNNVKTIVKYKFSDNGFRNSGFFKKNFSPISILLEKINRKLKDINPDNHIPYYVNGKIVGINGKAYQITSFDEAERVIYAKKTEDRHFIFNYRHNSSYLINSIQSKNFDKSQIGRIQHCKYEFDATYKLFGLLRWSPSTIDHLFDVSETSNHYIKYQSPIEKYMPFGSALVTSIRLNEEHQAKRIKLSKGLALLLQEMMPTFFPENHERIKIIPLLDGQYAAKSLNPHLTSYEVSDKEDYADIRPENESNQIYIMLAEISQMNLGLASSFKNKFTKLLSYLYDYLIWLEGLPPGCGNEDFQEVASNCKEMLKGQENISNQSDKWNLDVNSGDLIPLSGGDGHLATAQADKKKFLKYGEDRLPEFLDIPLIIGFLESLGPEIFKKAKQRFFNWDEAVAPVSKKNIPNDLKGKHQCDICGRFSDPDDMCKVAEDEREICHNCLEIYIPNTVEAYEKILDQTVEFFKEEWGIELEQDVFIKATHAKEIDQLASTRYIPTRFYDARAIGLASTLNTIMLENFRPEDSTLATAIHEYTHIWQFKNLDHWKMRDDYGKLLIEGHAVWAELQKFPELEKGYLNRDDEYGNGYKLIKSMENETGKNPFEFLSEMYPIK